MSKANGVLLDLGFNSMHVDTASRGFSFQKDGLLDMRYDQTQGVTAARPPPPSSRFVGRELSGRRLCEAKYSMPGNEILGSSGAISPAEDPAVPAKQSHKPGAEGR